MVPVENNDQSVVQMPNNLKTDEINRKWILAVGDESGDLRCRGMLDETLLLLFGNYYMKELHLRCRRVLQSFPEFLLKLFAPK